MTEATPTKARKPLSTLFLITSGVLIVAALVLNSSIASLTDYYSKEPIALRKKLDHFDDSRLESFVPAYGRTGLTPTYGDVETDDELMQTFNLKNPGPGDEKYPNAMLFVTYYSDPRDQIPHTPEVCYRQAGDVVTNLRTERIEVEENVSRHGEIDSLGIDVTTKKGRVVILYVFCCNGDYYNDREKARFAIGWPGDKYTYFSKVEAIARYSSDADYDQAVARCKRLLSEALPILVQDHFPAKEDLKRR